MNLLKLFQKSRKVQPPEFRLVPNPFGAYELQRWDTRLRLYVALRVVRDTSEADSLIENLGRETLYWSGMKVQETCKQVDQGIVVL